MECRETDGVLLCLHELELRSPRRGQANIEGRMPGVGEPLVRLLNDRQLLDDRQRLIVVVRSSAGY